MQIVGASVLDDGIEAIAHRSGRVVVVEWARRVLKRHVRREPSLVKEVIGFRNEKSIIAAMNADGLNDEIQKRILDEWRSGKTQVFIHTKTAVTDFLSRAADTMDWIESLPDNDRRIRRIERMSWKDADDAALAWHEALAKAKVDNNARMSGVVAVADLEDGAFMARLTTEKALKSEGAMMGHCVGGYWSRVNSGQTQIYSLRDADGFPHVTIELGRTPEVKMADGTTVRVGTSPRPGVNYLHLTDSNWVAVQVRGKQNKRPIDRYLNQVTNWLAGHDIPWVEYGSELPDARPDRMIFVFNVGGSTGVNYDDPIIAHEVASAQMAKYAAKGTKTFNFGETYRALGLGSLHNHCASAEVVKRFLDVVTPSVVDVFSRVIEQYPFETAANRSGVALLAKLAGDYKLPVDEVTNVVFESVCGQQADGPHYSKQHLLASKGVDKALDVVLHSLPLAPLALLANGYAEGRENEVLNRIKPHLTESLNVMDKFPDRVHVIQSSYSGVTPDNIRQAFLYCGLVAEYAAARSKVIDGVKKRMSEIRMSIRKARPSGELTAEGINLMRNMLSDGYEARINNALGSKFGKSGFVVAFEDVKPQPAPRLSADPVVRPTRYPAMRL